jgi:hypothetical protein
VIMRVRALGVLIGLIALLASVAAFTMAGPSHARRVGGPDFLCVTAWNIGVCIGPPTTTT